MYDFANTIYSMNVVSLYFPLVITANLAGKDIHVSIANSVSMLLVVLTMPFLGILSDKMGRRTPFLAIFTLLSVIATAAIGFFMDFGILPVLLCFVLANYGFHGGNVFYNTLLPQVSSREDQGRASGIGTALGYLGSIFGMAMVLPFNTGDLFGLNIPFIEGGGRQATFLPTAILFLLFALPTIIHFWERRKTPVSFGGQGNLRLLVDTIRNDPRGMGRFLIANFLFNDGVQTAIIFMAVFANKVLGMADDFLTKFFMFSTVGAVIGSYLFGILADKKGHRTALQFVLAGWVLSLALLALFPKPILLWVLGMPIGAFLGGVWTTARPIVLRLSPEGEEGRYFGLYAFSGKLAAIIGPLIWGGTVLLLKPISEDLAYRVAILALGGLIGIGWKLLRGVRDTQ